MTISRHSIFISMIFFLITFSGQAQDAIPPYDSLVIQSELLGESRAINIWTPPGYAISKASYPVLYMPDGAITEDFPHIANTLSELILAGKIPPTILVGIPNTQRRRDLTGPTTVRRDKKIAPVVGGSTAFRMFIRDELFPEIASRYRTNGQKTIIGESLAGLFIIETFLMTPDMFDNYIAFDPSLWWNKHQLVNGAAESLKHFPKAEKRLWFAGSSVQDIYPHTRQLAEILRNANLGNLKVNYSDEPGEKHNTIFRATKVKALEWTLGDDSR